MYKVINCLEESNKYINRVSKKINLTDGIDIASNLIQTLNKKSHAVGLTAPQCGINASVCIIHINKNKSPIILINPVIIEAWDKIQYKESCLSFPKKSAIVNRYKFCVVKDDLYEGKYYFGPNLYFTEIELLESIVVQHKLDHLNGKTII